MKINNQKFPFPLLPSQFPLEIDADVHQIRIWTNLTGNRVDLPSDKNFPLKTEYQSEYWF